jgi:23S rRNA (cytidine1920-2'-O)/16S rRNA (cytidine1409-2'-O)-methyltransferase
LKERLDVLLVEKGFFSSRERAKASIMAGEVYVDGRLSDKAGTKIDPDADIEVRGDDCPYVSRGGYKLERAIEVFGLDLSGAVCVDIGASTGGFTDCMLQHGAKKVYAIDVGYGQLDWKLRSDPRVVSIERCNIRYFDPDTLEEPADFVSIDVSFISLRLVFPVAEKLLSESGRLVCLVKPQFEAGKEQADAGKGIIRDPSVHEQAIRDVIRYAEACGLSPFDLTYSPVTGAKGNIEFLLLVGKNDELRYNLKSIQEVVASAHKALAEAPKNV